MATSIGLKYRHPLLVGLPGSDEPSKARQLSTRLTSAVEPDHRLIDLINHVADGSRPSLRIGRPGNRLGDSVDDLGGQRAEGEWWVAEIGHRNRPPEILGECRARQRSSVSWFGMRANTDPRSGFIWFAAE